MSPTLLYRLSGLALLVALPLQVLGFVLHPPSEQVVDVLKPLYGPSHIILFSSWVIASLALPALFARQASRMGWFGLVSFSLTMLAAAYHHYLLLYEAYAAPLLAQNQATRALIGDGPLAHGAGALGLLAFLLPFAFTLFGIATLRARVFPAAVGWLLVACVPAFVLAGFVLPPDSPAPYPGVSPIALLYYLLFTGFGIAGYQLWQESRIISTTPVASPA